MTEGKGGEGGEGRGGRSKGEGEGGGGRVGEGGEKRAGCFLKITVFCLFRCLQVIQLALALCHRMSP